MDVMPASMVVSSTAAAILVCQHAKIRCFSKKVCSGTCLPQLYTAIRAMQHHAEVTDCAISLTATLTAR